MKPPIDQTCRLDHVRMPKNPRKHDILPATRSPTTPSRTRHRRHAFMSMSSDDIKNVGRGAISNDVFMNAFRRRVGGRWRSSGEDNPSVRVAASLRPRSAAQATFSIAAAAPVAVSLIRFRLSSANR